MLLENGDPRSLSGNELELQSSLNLDCEPRYRLAMNLEDHLGDIIRKARAMSNISAASAAKAAGLTEQELAALEESGTFTKKPDFDELGNLIGLHPGKLKSIADGWMPAKKDLSTWPELRPLTTSAEGITVN